MVKSTRPFSPGQPVLLDDPRPNSERLLATGTLQDTNFSDYLLFETTLVPSDKLYTSKREVLMAMSMQVGPQQQSLLSAVLCLAFAICRLSFRLASCALLIHSCAAPYATVPESFIHLFITGLR